MSRRGRAAALVLALALVGCAQVAPVGSSTRPTASRSSTKATASAATPPTPTAAGPTASWPTCAALAASLGTAGQAGQLVMVGVTGSLDAAERRAITEKRFGSVILMGNSTAGVKATRVTTDAVRALAGPGGIVVAVDQEGGVVQRLKGEGFDTIPSAAEQAQLPLSVLTEHAAGWGRQLADAGVRFNLAPVADVVPEAKASSNEPIGRLDRGFGHTPEVVSAGVAAFVAGMQQAGVGTSLKHFPNLGQVVGNTDFTANVRDAVTTADDPALAPYRAGLAAGATTVMVSTAYYTRIDATAPAAFSPTVVAIARDGLGFDGVIVSDDLGVAKAVAAVPASERAVRFVRAGGDLAISVDVPAASAMVDGLVTAASDRAFAARLAASAERVLTMKAGLGAASCQVVRG